MSGDINVLALVKGEERYIFVFNDESRGEALRILGRYASNAELSFSWYDAAVMSQKVRKSSAPDYRPDFFAGSSRFNMSAVEDLSGGDDPLV